MRLGVLAAFLIAAPCAAGERVVVMLEPPDDATLAWPSGRRAVVAELSLGDVELVLRSTRAATVADYEAEVLAAAAEPEAAGAVGVARQGSRGVAFVALAGARSTIRVEDDVNQGSVAEGAVALRVAELLRVRTFALPPPAPPPSSPPASPEPTPSNEPPRPSWPVWPWLGFGGVAARGASGAAPMVAIGLRVPLSGWFYLEPSAAFTVDSLDVETPAGEVALSARQATVGLVLAPEDPKTLSGGIGVNAGLVWLSGLPRASAGYAGTESGTAVSVVGLRGFGTWHTGSIAIMAFAEAALLLPAVSVRADGAELARVGQPWLMAGLAVGPTP